MDWAVATAEDLSDELLERVLDNLDTAASLARAAAVCRRWAAMCRTSERIWCALWLRQPWGVPQDGTTIPFDEIDPAGTPRPRGHNCTESWRDVCRHELPDARFDCVHTPEPTTGVCQSCGRQLTVTRRAPSGNMGLAFDTTVKILLLGSSCVGKTMFFNQFKTRFAYDVSNHNRDGAIGVDFCVKMCTMIGVDAKVSLWIMHHLPQGAPTSSAYHRGWPGYAIMFDVSKRDSFEAVETRWFPEVLQHWTFLGERGDILAKRGDINTLALVGVRQDLTTGRPRVVTTSEARKVVSEMEQRINELDGGVARRHRVRYLETNPETGDGVDRVVATLVKPKLQHYRPTPECCDDLLQEAQLSHKGEARCGVM